MKPANLLLCAVIAMGTGLSGAAMAGGDHGRGYGWGDQGRGHGWGDHGRYQEWHHRDHPRYRKHHHKHGDEHYLYRAYPYRYYRAPRYYSPPRYSDGWYGIQLFLGGDL